MKTIREVLEQLIPKYAGNPQNFESVIDLALKEIQKIRHEAIKKEEIEKCIIPVIRELYDLDDPCVITTSGFTDIMKAFMEDIARNIINQTHENIDLGG